MGIWKPALAVVCCAIALSGCNRSVSALDTRLPPEPLPSTPLEPVQSGQLEPLAPGQQPVFDAQGNPVPAGDPNQVASLGNGNGQAPQILQPGQVAPQAGAPASGGEALSREALAGTWTVASDNPDCRIILAFTKWSGGYRAATRRCNSPELASVSAWDVSGSSVVLIDGSGNRIAGLISAGPERYDGATSSGQRVVFSR